MEEEFFHGGREERLPHEEEESWRSSMGIGDFLGHGGITLELLSF